MKELKNEVFISVLMEDLIKITQFVTEKKKLKGTFDENQYNYEHTMQKIKIMNSTFMSSLSQWKNKFLEKPNFLKFCTNMLSPVGKNGGEETEFSIGKRVNNFSARIKSETFSDPLNTHINCINQTQRKKGLSKEELLFGY